MLQLKHARDDDRVLVPGTLDAISNLVGAGVLGANQGYHLTTWYSELRQIEAQLRLMNMTARHELPTDPSQLAKLAMLLDHEDANKLLKSVQNCRRMVREYFDALFDQQ